jgi:hypothetical protein
MGTKAVQIFFARSRLDLVFWLLPLALFTIKVLLRADGKASPSYQGRSPAEME